MVKDSARERIVVLLTIVPGRQRCGLGVPQLWRVAMQRNDKPVNLGATDDETTATAPGFPAASVRSRM
jgi:hypothetical protein